MLVLIKEENTETITVSLNRRATLLALNYFVKVVYSSSIFNSQKISPISICAFWNNKPRHLIKKDNSFFQIGTYHTVALRVASKPPTPGIVSRGIALEGFCSILAGLWGTGAGSTTLTENVHTIHVTKVASRRALEVGAVFLIFVSFIGNLSILSQENQRCSWVFTNFHECLLGG